MNDQLFDVPETLSPRLAWMKKHGVMTYKSPDFEPEEDPWCAWLPENNMEELGLPEDLEQCGLGQTEDEAITALAVLHNIRLWNEPQLSPASGDASGSPAVAKCVPVGDPPTLAGVYGSTDSGGVSGEEVAK